MEAFPAETASLAAKKASGAAKKKYRSNKEAGNRADTIAQFEAQFGEAGKAVVAEWRGFWDKISKNYNVVKADDFLTNEKAYKFLVETTKTSNQKLGVPKRNDAIKFLEFQFGEEKVKNAIKEAVDRLRAEAKIRGTRVEKVPGYDHVSSVWRDYDIETRFLSDR
ncbi:unnamed protein product [Hyaloperonospora brassicae]|uniref:RxLR effector protein n=1 Tax=Hyaloperonospora brassicae TaxID=162125 RepID=A0AAV0TKE8_HYABA|nr:unnamed protein product [Hyaloperonospora brassicae]